MFLQFSTFGDLRFVVSFSVLLVVLGIPLMYGCLFSEVVDEILFISSLEHKLHS